MRGSRVRIPTEPMVGTLFVNNICTQASWLMQNDKQIYRKEVYINILWNVLIQEYSNMYRQTKPTSVTYFRWLFRGINYNGDCWHKIWRDYKIIHTSRRDWQSVVVSCHSWCLLCCGPFTLCAFSSQQLLYIEVLYP